MVLLLIFLVILPWSIYRQMKVHVLTHGGVLKMPIVFAAVGVFGFGTGSIPIDFEAISYLAMSVLLSVGLGIWRGLAIPVWKNDEGLYVSQGDRTTLALWVVLIVSKFALGTVASLTDWYPGSQPGEIFVFIALSFLAQNLIVAQRAGGWASLPDSDEAAGRPKPAAG